MIIADTSFWLALLNSRDRYHSKAVKALREINEPLITTWPVLTETCHLLLSRLGVHAQVQFMAAIEDGISEIHQPDTLQTTRLRELMGKYQQLPMDLADASLVVLAEIQHDGRILSTDQRDFGIYRWKNTKPFENLLFQDK